MLNSNSRFVVFAVAAALAFTPAARAQAEAEEPTLAVPAETSEPAAPASPVPAEAAPQPAPAPPAAIETLPAPDTPAASNAPASVPDVLQPIEPTLEEVARELAMLLTNLGLPSDASRRNVTLRIGDLAQQSATMSRQLSDPARQLEAKNLEMQAYNALLQHTAGDDREASHRVGQIRAAAYGAKQIEVRGAQPVGDFWLMQADLVDLNRSVSSLEARQRAAVDRLERFLRDHQPVPGDATPLQVGIDTQVRLSLLRLYDCLGQSEKVRQLVSGFRADPSLPETQRAMVDEQFGYVDLLGEPFEAGLKTADGSRWLTSEQRGRVVVLYFFGDDTHASLSTRAALRAMAIRHESRPVSILAVDVRGGAVAQTAPGDSPALEDAGDMAEGERQDPWPVYRAGPGQVNLAELFQVRTLPRFVIIDASGRVAGFGDSPAALRRVDELLAQ